MARKNELTFAKIMRWSDERCCTFLEASRWPDGPVCPKCGGTNPWTINRRCKTKNRVRKLYRCRECRRQFSATVGTIFEDSKIPLSKWFAAIYLMCSSKKGISAHQLHRTLDITYKSAWFMCHRIRTAMSERDSSPVAGTVEADETYIGPRRPRGHPEWVRMRKWEEKAGLRSQSSRSPKKHARATVFGLLERDGRARTLHVKDATAMTLQPLIHDNVDRTRTRLMTDRHPAYRALALSARHHTVNHELTYVDGDVHIQGLENYWSLLKRGIVDTFHHVDADYLRQYLNEFEFRFNRRKISDPERFAALMGQTRGRLLWYCRTPQPENPHA